jgi:asparagine synthase (glutamine-hydrolysing)
MRPAILRRLYPYLKHSPVSAGAFARQFFMQGMEAHDLPYFAHVPRWTTTQRLWQFFSADVRASLTGWDPYAHVARTLPGDIARWPALARDQYVEAHTLLSGYLLASQGDRVAMANSIEARFPFLDHRVIEYANRLPTQYKIHGLNEKFILKKAMGPWVPAPIRTRTKQPYRAPDSQSFFREGRGLDYVEELLSEASLRRRGYFEPKAVRMLYEKCRSGRAIGFVDNMAFVGILSTMLIDAMFVQGESRWRLAGAASERDIGVRAIN